MAKKKQEKKTSTPTKAPIKPSVKKQRNNLLPALLCAAIIAVITWFVFLPSMQNEFTNWDDPTYVTDNPLVVNTTVPVKEIFKTPVSLNYHPLTILTLAWNYQSGKLNPVGYHLVNVILHILNTLLVFLFIFLLTKRNLLMAAFVALFFGIHPMHVESVSWVSERKDVLYVFFFLAGLITYLQYKQSRNVLWYIATLLLFVLSCLSKGMAVVFPVILLLIDYLLSEKAPNTTAVATKSRRARGMETMDDPVNYEERKTIKWNPRIFLDKIPFFIIAIVIGVIAFKIQAGGAIADVRVFTPFQRFMFASYGAIEYVVKLFVPVKLSTFYPYPTLDKNGNIPFIFYLYFYIMLVIVLAFVAAIIFVYFGRKFKLAFAERIYSFHHKQKAIVFGLLFYFVSVALVLQFISVGSAILADRYSYLSYIGLFFALAWILNESWQAKNKILSYLKYPLTAIALIAAVIFCNQTYARTKIWKNTETLWTDVVTNYPSVETAWKNRGNYYGQHTDSTGRHDDVDKAMHDYRILVKMNTHDSRIYSNLGNVYGLRGQADSALWAYTEAIKMDPRNTDAYINRAITYCMGKQYDRALPDFEKALYIDHNLYSVYSNRGYAYLATGKYQESINDYSLYLQMKPEDGSAYYYRALAEKALSRTDEYNKDLQQAKNMGFKVPEEK